MNLSNLLGRSLKVRLVLTLLVIFLLSIWSLSLYVSRSLRKELTHDLFAQQSSTASIVAATIEDEFKLRTKSLEELAAKIAPVMSNQAELRNFLSHQTGLEQLFNGGIIVTDRTGIAIGQLPLLGGRLGINYGNDEWVSAALKGSPPTIGRPIMGKVLHAPVFGMTVPVRDAKGRVIGTAGGVINLGKPSFLDVFTKHYYGTHGNFLLVSPQSRQIVTASDTRRVMEQLPPRGANPSLDLALDRTGGSYEFVNAQGVEVLTAAARIPESGWHVVASLPVKEAFAPVQSMNQRTQLMAFLLSLLVIVVTWLTLRRQLAPITEAAQALASASRTNQLPQFLPTKTRDEVGELTSGFNRLVETLDKRERMLRDSEEKFRSFFQQAGEYAFILDPQDGHNLIIADANDMACVAHGLSREELIGKPITDLDSSGIDDKKVAELLGAVMSKGLVKFETAHRRKDGTSFPVEVTAKLIQISGRSPLILSMERDLTERKRLEEARLNSQRLESLGTLAGGIAHDFNNILGAIQGNADLATEDVDPNSPVGESIAEIKKASLRATDLVRRIMAFGRPKKPRKDSVDLDQIVGEVLKLLRPTIPAGIELHTAFAPGLPAVWADASQVHEALVNLTTNATYAIGNRAGSIEYRTESAHLSEDAAARLSLLRGDYVVVTVKDDGAGMDEATQRRIFDAFFTTKPAGDGSGLGLSVVYGIMKGHAGAASVESAPGGGSSFHLYFPVSNADVADSATSKATAGKSAVPSSRLRVMYVDDEEALVKLGGRELEQLGHIAKSYSHPAKALEAYRADPQAFDLVVTDLSMPQMSGVEFTRAVKSIRPDVPVIMTTGNISAENEALARKAGVSDLLLKPMSMEQLGEAIERALRAHERHR